MNGVVADTTYDGKTQGCRFSNAAADRATRYWGMANKRSRKPTFIRQWRQHRGFSLDQLAERVPMDKGNLSKVERGLLPYNQELLERIADALMTDAASLLMRDPTDSAAIWSLWDRATLVERRQIEGMANALIDAKKRA